jgi:hypothetical protein
MEKILEDIIKLKFQCDKDIEDAIQDFISEESDYGDNAIAYRIHITILRNIQFSLNKIICTNTKQK